MTPVTEPALSVLERGRKRKMEEKGIVFVCEILAL